MKPPRPQARETETAELRVTKDLLEEDLQMVRQEVAHETGRGQPRGDERVDREVERIEMQKARAYIKRLEEENDELEEQLVGARERIEGLEGL